MARAPLARPTDAPPIAHEDVRPVAHDVAERAKLRLVAAKRKSNDIRPLVRLSELVVLDRAIRRVGYNLCHALPPATRMQQGYLTRR